MFIEMDVKVKGKGDDFYSPFFKSKTCSKDFTITSLVIGLYHTCTIIFHTFSSFTCPWGPSVVYAAISVRHMGYTYLPLPYQVPITAGWTGVAHPMPGSNRRPWSYRDDAFTNWAIAPHTSTLVQRDAAVTQCNELPLCVCVCCYYCLREIP